MKATIRMAMDNASFADGNGRELARMLRQLADALQDGDFQPDSDPFKLTDYNGNRVGTMTFTR